MTGLVNDDVFSHRLRGLIERSQRFNRQSAVVLVDFTNPHRLREEFGRKYVLEVLLRPGAADLAGARRGHCGT